jgi:adenylosuccinate lyase
MRAERMCGLARFVSALSVSAAQTAATQWLERTLDDSVNRRLTLPQAFLATDGVLRLALNLARGLVVRPEVITRHWEAVLPFLATENLLMAAAEAGGDRQLLHERIRQHSHAVAEHQKASGGPNDLLDRLRADPEFSRVDFKNAVQPGSFIGRAPQQVDEFVREVIMPIRQRYPHLLQKASEDELRL